MKSKILTLTILFIYFLISSCGDENCSPPNIGNISTPGNNASFFISSTSGAGFHEIEYGPLGYNQGNGITLQVNDGEVILENLQNGTYDIYMRSNCGGEDWSKWSDPESFLID